MIPYFASTYGSQRTSYVMFALSQVLFPLSFIYVNQHKFNPVETMMVRGFATLLLNFCIVRYYDMSLDYKYDINFSSLFKRSTILVIHGLTLTAAQQFLPMSIVMTLSNSAPIFIFILDYFLNGVKINKSQLIFLIFGVLGIIFTINQEFLEKLFDPNSSFDTLIPTGQKSPNDFAFYALLVCGVMFLWAFAILRVRLFYKSNHTYTNFHFGMMLLISSGFLYPMRVQNPQQVYKIGIACLLTGLPLALSQVFSVASLAMNKKTGTMVVMQSTTIITSYLIEFFRYNEIPHKFEAIGSLLIIGSVMGVIKLSDQEVKPIEPIKTQSLLQSRKKIFTIESQLKCIANNI